MFTGTYSARIDNSGRVYLPAPFRAVLQDVSSSLVIVRSPAWPALEVWTEDGLKTIEDNLHPPDARRVLRYLAAQAVALDLDKRGRFVFHRRLRKAAGLRDEVLFIGVEDIIRIWDPDTYEKHLVELASDRAG